MPVTAPVSLTKVKAEFGGVANNLKAYNRGGARVPNIAANNAISTDPNSLRLSQFLNATNVVATVQITDQLVFDNRESGSFATLNANYTLNSNGTAQYSTSQFGGVSIPNEWGTGVTGSNFEVRAVLIAGTTPTGPALNTWHSLSVQRQWSLVSDITVDHVLETYLTVSIRRVSDQVVVDTAQIALEVRRGAPL